MKYFVTLQASATIKIQRHIEAPNEHDAKSQLIDLLTAINSGLVAQQGDFTSPPFGDASFEITEAPQEGHDFKVDEIEVELEDDDNG